MAYWQGTPPVVCDLVGYVSSKHDDLFVTGEFVDGKTQGGPWGNMCMACHARYGVGLGTGSGQHYRRQTDGKWLKVAG